MDAGRPTQRLHTSAGTTSEPVQAVQVPGFICLTPLERLLQNSELLSSNCNLAMELEPRLLATNSAAEHAVHAGTMPAGVPTQVEGMQVACRLPLPKQAVCATVMLQATASLLRGVEYMPWTTRFHNACCIPSEIL